MFRRSSYMLYTALFLISFVYGAQLYAQAPPPPPPPMAELLDFIENDTDGYTDNIACTADAKICPDGTSVGRTGPNCEFVDCPVYETAPPVEEEEVDEVEVDIQDFIDDFDGWGTELPDVPAQEDPVPPSSDYDDYVDNQPAPINVPSVSYRFSYGDIVYVPVSAEVWDEPGIGAAKLGIQQRSERGAIIDGPVEADGNMWWEVDFNNGADGWTIERQLTSVAIPQDEPMYDDESDVYDGDDETTHDFTGEDIQNPTHGEPTEIVPWWPVPEEGATQGDGFFRRIVNFFKSIF